MSNAQPTGPSRSPSNPPHRAALILTTPFRVTRICFQVSKLQKDAQKHKSDMRVLQNELVLAKANQHTPSSSRKRARMDDYDDQQPASDPSSELGVYDESLEVEDESFSDVVFANPARPVRSRVLLEANISGVCLYLQLTCPNAPVSFGSSRLDSTGRRPTHRNPCSRPLRLPRTEPPTLPPSSPPRKRPSRSTASAQALDPTQPLPLPSKLVPWLQGTRSDRPEREGFLSCTSERSSGGKRSSEHGRGRRPVIRYTHAVVGCSARSTSRCKG